MYLLRVSQKILFFCNGCWLATVLFRMISLAHWPESVVKTIVILGWAVALPLGVLWYLVFAFLCWKKKAVAGQAERFLVYINLAFLPFVFWSVLLK